MNFSRGHEKKVGEDASFGAIFILVKSHNVVNVFICLEHKKCVEMSMHVCKCRLSLNTILCICEDDNDVMKGCKWEGEKLWMSCVCKDQIVLLCIFWLQ